MVVREAMACYGLGDEAGFMSFLSEDVEWIVHASEPLPIGGTLRGPQAVGDFFRHSAKLLQISGVLWSNFIAAGDMAAVYGMASHRCLLTGSQDTTAFAHWYEVRDEKIIRAQQFLDTSSLHRMMEGKPGLRPVSRNASTTAEAIGQLAATSNQIDADDRQDAGWLLSLYGHEAPPRSIRLIELADKNIEWNSSGLGSLPTGGPFYGHEAFARHMQLARQLLGSYVMEIDGQIHRGNTLALHGRLILPPVLAADGPVHWFQALTISDGRLVRGLEVMDSQKLLDCLHNAAAGEA